MDDKDEKIIDPSTTLILDEKYSLDNNIHKKEIISKINKLLKNKYLHLEKSQNTKINDEINLDSKKIIGEARKTIDYIRKKTFKINKSIDHQEMELKALYNEKELLNKHKIQSEIINKQQELIDNNKQNNTKLKSDLSKAENELNEKIQKNRSLEINNHELKNTVDRYIVNTKKLQKEIIQLKTDQTEGLVNNEKLKEINLKIKFFQEENVRLASELLSSQERFEAVKNNFNSIEKQKNEISQQIQNLNQSINKANANIVHTTFAGDFEEDELENISDLTDIYDTKKNDINELYEGKEEESLSEVYETNNEDNLIENDKLKSKDLDKKNVNKELDDEINKLFTN